MERHFKGWDQGFNVMVLRMAELVCPGGFDRGPDAPSTLEELNAYVRRTGRIKVSDQNMAGNVFGCGEVNLACRAWHDWTHYNRQTPFTLEGERATFKAQLEDMQKVYGIDATTLRWAQMLHAEVVGQVEYEQRWGVFPVAQYEFDLAYMADPARTLGEDFWGKRRPTLGDIAA